MNNLIDILKDKMQLPAERANALIAIGKERAIAQNECFIEEGSIPKAFGFVVSGLFRYVYVNDKGTEFTKAIIQEHNFISSYSAMISHTSSFFFIEALEASQIIEIKYTQWLALKESNPFWDKFLVKLLERAFSIKEKRERDFLLLDAETRYLNFRNDFPGIENRIKQHIIASFLGIQPESLSRIRKRIQFLTHINVFR